MKNRRWKCSQVMAAMLAAAMTITTVLQPINTQAAVPNDNYENKTKKVLWSTSFEDGESALADFQESAAETGGRGTVNVESGLSISDLKGDITNLVDLSSINTNVEIWNQAEGVEKLFDKSPSTKFYTRMNNTNHSAPTPEKPITVNFALKDKKAEVVKVYSVTSANDAAARDPKAWILYGSKDGEEFVELDRQSEQFFSNRFERKTFEIENAEEYAYYRFDITGNNDSWAETQVADLQLGTGEERSGNPYMASELATGPSDAWNQATNRGWSGSKSLEVSGIQKGNTAFASNVLFDNLNTKVTEDTYLSYVIFPALASAAYDYEYTSMHMAIDLKFKDGTYLSDLKALDQNENELNAAAQGASRVLTTNQWNRIYSNIGKVANGKTVEQVLVVFDKNAKEAADDAYFKTYFDDIELYTKQDTKRDHLSDYVYILRGTNDTPGFSRGLTAPAVTAPHGFNFWVPCTNNGGSKTYDYQDTKLQHVSISREASYWIGDRGTWQFMVNTSLNGDSAGFSGGQKEAEFSHDNEVAKAHYYSVEFDDRAGNNAQGAKMEVTSTDHCGVVRATFNEKARNKNFLFDCVNADGTFAFSADKKSFHATSDHRSLGLEKMYVYGEFDKVPTKGNVDDKRAVAQFEDNQVVLKIATSFISPEQAQKNLQLEVGTKTFDQVMTEAQKVWDDKLHIIDDVKGATEEELISLYSSMYRLFMYPNNLSENTGTNEKPVWKYKSPYRGASGEPVAGYKLYYNNGFWDTYRTTWSAYALLTPNKAPELLNGLVQHYHDQNWIPRWIAPGGANSMVGTSSDVVFGDAMMKGIPFDDENAYKAAIRNAATVSSNLTGGGRKNLNTSIFAGYTAGTGENFSWSMEGYINDYGISQMAKLLAEREKDPAKKADYLSEYQYYLNRAQNYALLFDDAGDDLNQKWLRGRDADGSWTKENMTNGVYDPVRWQGDYTETNGYNMSVSVPQDAQGLANLYGGRDQLAAKIDSILADNSPYSGYGAEGGQGGIHEQLEAREVKMGQYGHNNQPSHHILYMYNYAGQPWKTQQYIRDVLDRCFTGATFGQGYLGDEDNGEMSGWYVFSSLGFYPVTVGSDEYTIGSPLFDSATVNMDNGKQIKITAKNNSKKNVYIQSMTLNGEAYTKNYLKHADLKNGAEIVFNMGDKPNQEWGSKESDLPTSINKGTDVPDPKRDATASAVAEDNAENVSPKPVEIKTLYGDTTDVANLIDDKSDTAAPLNSKGTTTLVFASGAAKDVELVTLTSDNQKGTAPTGLKVYGANENEPWTELADYKNISFEWTQYTRPFAINNHQGYNFYKIELTGGSSLAEIELLAPEDIELELGALIARAKKAIGDHEDLDAAKREAIIDQAAAAKVVLDNPEKTKEEMEEAYQALLKLVTEVESIRSAHSRIEAEEFSAKASQIVNDGSNIGGVIRGTWTMYQDVKFEAPVGSFEIYYSAQDSDAGGVVDVYLDEKDNPEKKLLSIDVPKTGGWGNYQLVSTKDVNYGIITPGYHDVYLTFNNDGSHSYVSNVDWFRFNKMDHEDVIAKIEAIGDVENITLEKAPIVSEARRLYEALGNREKAEVTNRKKLEEAERALKEREDELQAVDNVIAQIGAIGIVTLDSEEAIKAARTAYDALTDEQKKAVANAAVLEKAEADLAQMKTDKALAEAVVELIGRIGSPAGEAAMRTARAAYDVLNDVQKGLVGVENLTKLTNAEVQIAQKKGDEAAADKVTELINAVTDVTINSETAIAAARTAYNNLSDAQKALVKNLKTLENAEAKIVELKNAAAAAGVEGLIGNIGQVALNSETAIVSARTAYNNLSDAQKNLVTNVKVLEDAERALAQAKTDKNAADAVVGLIEQMDDSSEEAVAAARAAYDKLTDAQKAMVGVASLTKLTNAEAKISQGTSGQDRAAQVTEMIGKLTNVSLDSAKDVEKARIAYDLLNADQKKLVTNVKVLEDAEKKIADLRKAEADKAEAEKVSSLIGSIGDVALNSETAIASARAAYNNLSADQKKLVTNAKALEDAEKALAQAKEDKKAADAVISLIGKLTSDSKADVEAARAAYNQLSDAQKAMVGVGTLAKLTEAEKQVAENDKEPGRLATPKILSVKSSMAKKATGRVKISFQKPAAGQKIYVYRKIGGLRKYIGKTTGSYIYDNTPVSGKTVSYFIKAVPNDKTKFRTSLHSKLVNLTLPANPSSLKVKALGKKQVKVSWSGVKGADKYYVYRSTKKDSGYTRIASVKASKKSYVDKKATAGKTYYYKVVVKRASKYSAGKASKAVKAKK